MTGLFSAPKIPSPPVIETPPPPEPEVMPDPEDALLKQRKRQEASKATQRSGRMSTILSDAGGSDKLGA